MFESDRLATATRRGRPVSPGFRGGCLHALHASHFERVPPLLGHANAAIDGWDDEHAFRQR